MISVIIPVFNMQDYIADAIESVLDQTCLKQNNNYDLMELIIVDDGSTDGSLEIAKKYQKEFSPHKVLIKVISQVNKGLASARNTGIMNCQPHTYGYCLFLDADDILLPEAIKKIGHLINQTAADTFEYLDIVAPSFKTFGTSNEQVILMKDPKLEDFRTGNRIGYCAAIRKSALLEVGGYSPRMVEGYEDLHLIMNLLSRGAKIVTIPEVLWLYRTKEKSMWKDITPEIHKKLIAQINADIPSAELNF